MRLPWKISPLFGHISPLIYRFSQSLCIFSLARWLCLQKELRHQQDYSEWFHSHLLLLDRRCEVSLSRFWTKGDSESQRSVISNVNGKFFLLERLDSSTLFNPLGPSVSYLLNSFTKSGQTELYTPPALEAFPPSASEQLLREVCAGSPCAVCSLAASMHPSCLEWMQRHLLYTLFSPQPMAGSLFALMLRKLWLQAQPAV